MARIGIFGGTFNPIHNGHLKIAYAALEQYQLDQVLFMPAGIPPHKQVDGHISAGHRLAMVQAAVEDENMKMHVSRFAVSDYELLQGGKSYTYKTLEYFCRRFPQNEYYFVIGEDSLRSFSTWRNPEKICEMARLLVAVRQDQSGCDMRELQREIDENRKRFGSEIYLLQTENFPVSSTEIRKFLYQNDPIRNLLPGKVYDYILEYGLYKMKNTNYDLESMEHVLKKELSSQRYRHTMGVMYTAAALAMKYLYPIDEAMAAGLLHDCAKCISDKEKLDICRKNNLSVSETEAAHPQLLHAKVGAYLAESIYGVKDETILHAIKVHTTGTAKMSLLDKIIFAADYIEPGRQKAPRLSYIRQMAFTDIDRCCAMILQDTMEYLSGSEKAMDQTTAEAFSYYQKYL